MINKFLYVLKADPYHVKEGEKGGQFTTGPHQGEDAVAQAHSKLKLSDDTEQALRKKHQKWRANWLVSLDSRQYQATLKYSSGSQRVNDALRKYGHDKVVEFPDSLSDQVKAIESTLSPLPEDTVVYRGIRNPASIMGKTIRDEAFVSTSVSPEIAKGFGQHVVAIKVPKGTPVAYGLYDKVDNGLKNEYEIILPPKSSFEIDARTKLRESYDVGEPHKPREYIEATYVKGDK